MEISSNKLVKIHYKGTLEDGSVFDSSEGREALEFIAGAGMIIPGLDKGLEGLKAGDKKTVEVKAEDAYGPRIDEAMQEVPKDQFPTDIELKEGMQLAAQGPQGVIPVVIVAIGDETIKVDFNHPLSGKNLKFECEVVEVADATEEDMKKLMPEPHKHDHEGGCCGGNGSCDSEDKKNNECCGSGQCSTEDKKEN